MSERYQIKAKIGQGGIGAVYRAFDTHLQREVAVKRLLPPDESESFDDDPTKSLFKEAHLLSALQHPNVVSVYDVGTDDDGVFVVMELVDGETFDQVVDRGLLTEDDFAEMVSQTLEALIAAQDKALVHRDIKPTNLMVKWLPSGKFQFKLLDFGLAKFSPKPSQQTIGFNDAILGSIHFMAPEQFERLPLDGRTDLYAIGCMYYFGLTGRYPFDGDTAAEVMAAHLSHRLTPMQEIRPDLTKRTCDWVMWLMSRDMNARPATAQEALEVFFNADFQIPGAQAAPRLILPGTAGMAPKLGATPAQAAPAARTISSGVRPASGAVRLGSAPVRLGSGVVRTGAAPVRAGTSGVRMPGASAAVQVPQMDAGVEMETAIPHILKPSTAVKKKSPVVKWAIISSISATLILGIGIIKLTSGSSAKKEEKRIIEYLNSDDTTGDANQVKEIVPYLMPPSTMARRDDIVGNVVDKLVAMKGTDVEAAIIEELEKSRGKVQEMLIGVVAKREMKDAMGALTRIAMEGEPLLAGRAIEAMSVLGDSRDARTVATVMMDTSDASLRRKAEMVMQVFIEKATSKGEIVGVLEKGLDTSRPKEVQQASLRLLGMTGDASAGAAIDRVLAGGDDSLKVAAVLALREWPDDSMLDRLAELAGSGKPDAVKSSAFEAFVTSLCLHQDRKRSLAQHQAWWGKAELLAATKERKFTFLRGLAMVPENFAKDIATRMEKDADPNVQAIAKIARQQIQGAMAQKPKQAAPN